MLELSLSIFLVISPALCSYSEGLEMGGFLTKGGGGRKGACAGARGGLGCCCVVFSKELKLFLRF